MNGFKVDFDSVSETDAFDAVKAGQWSFQDFEQWLCMKKETAWNEGYNECEYMSGEGW